MPFQIRLQSGGAYSSDIRALRAGIRANGTLQNIQPVTITHQNNNNTVILHVNLAYQPNSQLQPINASLYAVGFANTNGAWFFNTGLNLGAVQMIPGNLDGSYRSLNNPLGLPAITNENLANAVASVSAYNGTAPVPVALLDDLARLIIAVNEAARFDSVEAGIDGALRNAPSVPYQPPVQIIHNWGGHTLGS
jgi:hypothetical protein